MADIVSEFLLNQLSTFVKEEQKLLGGLGPEVELIRLEFDQMKAFLQAEDSFKKDDPRQAEWTRQVREAAYDIEDVLAEFRILFDRQRPRGFFGHVRSYFNSLKNLPDRHRLATKLQSIKARINLISEARRRYETEHDIMTAQVSRLLPGNSDWRYNKDDEALYANEDQLVGIDKPKQDLISQILDKDSRLKVIAVLGMGGIGKTTLVKRVHSDVVVENHFRIRAWVTVSQTYDLKELFKDLIGKLHAGFKESAPSGMDLMGVDDLKVRIREFLQRDRYAIVFDDVWDTNFWGAFRFLPDNSYGGNRVILTTRIADVASSCIDLNGSVFRKEFLTFQESMTLFCRKTFKDNCYPVHLEDIVKSIVEKCEGLPLAIVAIGGVLATKDLNRIDEWERIRCGLGNESEGAGKLDGAKKILSLSYDDLPPTLKTCLLYTCIFPEDYRIDCMPLIGLWIAERFVAGKAGRYIEEVGWDYIKELANRSLIQLGEMDYNGLPRAFQIHDLLREVIVTESRKINLMTVIETTQHASTSWSPAENVARRLVFRGDDSFHEFVAQQSSFNCLRSIITFDCSEPPSKALLSELLSSKFLKVVNFQDMQLKETLECIDAAESDKTRIITEIGKLTLLRTLAITNLRREDGKELCSSLENLRNLQELTVSSIVRKDEEVITLDLNHHISTSSLQSICFLDLRGRLEKMPPWLANLQKLGLINLIGSGFRDDPLELLQHLPNLIKVDLNEAYEGESLSFKSGGFQKLRDLELRKMKGLRRIRVEEGAMPGIKILFLDELPLVEEVPSGVEHLRELEELRLWDMSSELTNKLKKGSEDYNKKRIGHIPKVYIDGRML